MPENHVQRVHIGIELVVDGIRRLPQGLVQVVFLPVDHLAADLDIAYDPEQKHGDQTDQDTDGQYFSAKGQVVKKGYQSAGHGASSC